MGTFIIAEAGVNHNGDLELARQMVDSAVKAGADAIKFQTFKAEKLVSKLAEKADYQKRNAAGDESQYEMIKRLELDINTHRILIADCHKKNIQFLSTPFDHESIDLLNSLGLAVFKIPSGEITNKPYLEHIGSLKKEVIISTGMATMDEIEKALGILKGAGTDHDKITILHANTEYPTPLTDVNLRAMVSIGQTFHVRYGYSDHTLGITIPIAAVSLGASVIEKHFTLDKTLQGPDHKASIDPDELVSMVNAIRSVEIALGSPVKKPSPSEIKNIYITRKSIHLANDVKAGKTLTKEDLCMKRPGDGISPMEIDQIVNRVILKDLVADTKLKWEDFA